MTIKTFRGQLADNSNLRIRLSTNTGEIGYIVKKFQVVHEVESDDLSATVSLFSQKPDTNSASINFDNPLLLGVNYSRDGTTTERVVSQVVIFDHVKVNQDMYITHVEASGSESVNFYIELEQFKLSLDEATVATLKDMRGNYTNQDP